jgi:hypothetical protein
MVCSVRCAMNLDEGIMSSKATWTHKKWLAKLQDDINKAVRLIDKGHQCISNGSFYKEGGMDAGHYYARSTHPTLRYHLLNIWGQSKYDNQYMEGNRQGFYKGLYLVGGDSLLDEIESLPGLFKTAKWSIPELSCARDVVRSFILDYQKKNYYLADQDRIELKRELTKLTGLYN